MVVSLLCGTSRTSLLLPPRVVLTGWLQGIACGDIWLWAALATDMWLKNCLARAGLSLWWGMMASS
eukprot:4679299-Pyramimonas_sp.AAC.1